jgi:hypothetical protein
MRGDSRSGPRSKRPADLRSSLTVPQIVIRQAKLRAVKRKSGVDEWCNRSDQATKHERLYGGVRAVILLVRGRIASSLLDQLCQVFFSLGRSDETMLQQFLCRRALFTRSAVTDYVRSTL